MIGTPCFIVAEANYEKHSDHIVRSLENLYRIFTFKGYL